MTERNKIQEDKGDRENGRRGESGCKEMNNERLVGKHGKQGKKWILRETNGGTGNLGERRIG